MNKHPWNKGKTQGSIMDPCGYVCTAPEEDTNEHFNIFFDLDSPLNGCELHSPATSTQKESEPSTPSPE